MKTFLLTMALYATSFVMPGTVQANEYVEPEATVTAPVQETILETIINPLVVVKYATTETGIYLKPLIDSEPFDMSEINTSFEVICEADGWSMITTEDGYAYVQSDFLSEEPVKSYSEEDLYYLTGILVGECHGYSWEHQIAVGSVVLNRVNDIRYPNTIKEVATQKGQYSCLRNRLFYREPTERNIEVAKFLLENGSQIPEYVIFQSREKQGNGIWKVIDGQYFCY